MNLIWTLFCLALAQDHSGPLGWAICEHARTATGHSGIPCQCIAVLVRHAATSTWQILHCPRPETLPHLQEGRPSQTISSHHPAGHSFAHQCPGMDSPLPSPASPIHPSRFNSGCHLLQEALRHFYFSPLPVWFLSHFLV